MTDRHVLPPYSLRMTVELRQMLEEAAKKSKRSLNAEIIARLETTFSIEEALRHISSGAPLNETAQMLVDLAQEREDAIDDLHQMNLEVHARQLQEQLSHTDDRLDKIESRIEYMIEQFLLQKSKQAET